MARRRGGAGSGGGARRAGPGWSGRGGARQEVGTCQEGAESGERAGPGGARGSGVGAREAGGDRLEVGTCQKRAESGGGGGNHVGRGGVGRGGRGGAIGAGRGGAGGGGGGGPAPGGPGCPTRSISGLSEPTPDSCSRSGRVGPGTGPRGPHPRAAVSLVPAPPQRPKPTAARGAITGRRSPGSRLGSLSPSPRRPPPRKVTSTCSCHLEGGVSEPRALVRKRRTLGRY